MKLSRLAQDMRYVCRLSNRKTGADTGITVASSKEPRKIEIRTRLRKCDGEENEVFPKPHRLR